MGIDRLAWRTLASRPLRSLLTIAGIGLGVAVLCASLTLGAALDDAVQRTVNDMVGRADVRVSGFLEGGLSEGAVSTIITSENVVDAAPIVEHRTFPTSAPGRWAATFAQGRSSQKTARGKATQNKAIAIPNLVAGWTFPNVFRSHSNKGTNSRKPSAKRKVVPPRVGGASGRRPIDGPMTTRIAALSISLLCDWESRRLFQPFQTSSANGTITASGTIVHVRASVNGG